MTSLLGSLAAGLALGLQFNPMASLVGACAAAVVAGRPAAGRGADAVAASIALAAFIVGDGLRMFAAMPRQSGPATVELAVAMLACLTVGYALPAFAGAYVGKHVTRGLGWPSAAAVALAISGALTLVSGRVAEVAFAVASR